MANSAHRPGACVVIDYGVKRNILRHAGRRMAPTSPWCPRNAHYDDVMRHKPAWRAAVERSRRSGGDRRLFHSHDPGRCSTPNVPVFGICLGHQMLGLALGAKTRKMAQGHHGANHPVKDLETGKVEIVSMNHGFTVDRELCPRA